MSKRNLKCLALTEKFNLNAEVVKGEKKNKDISQHCMIPADTLSTIEKRQNFRKISTVALILTPTEKPILIMLLNKLC